MANESIRDLVYTGVYAGIMDARMHHMAYQEPPEPEPINSKSPIDIKVRTDVGTESDLRRKVLEWQVTNVSRLKTVASKKERAVRELIAKGINLGWAKKDLASRMVKDFEVTPKNARRIAVNEVRRAYNFAYKKTSYEFGYRKVRWKTHPGACKICIPRHDNIYPISAVSIPDDTHPNCHCTLHLTNEGFVSPYKKALPALPRL